MASAIGAGLIRKDILNPDNVWVSSRTDRMHSFWKNLKAHVTLENREVISNCDVIFLAVKPLMLDDVLTPLINIHQNMLCKKFTNKLIVSVLAGIPLNVLHSKLSVILSSPRIIRCMPNTPMIVGEGITVYSSDNANADDLKLVDTLFSYIGISQNVPEDLLNKIGGLSSSGPAFAYLITEALADGAVRMGVPRPLATKFAAQVLVGAGKMVLETEQHPGQLKDEVCSPGGTSISGIHAMEVGGVRGSMMNAVEAAVNKANEFTAYFKTS
ncbi:hypothetical protein PUN28_013074 [Cardiocondyla obscurior]